jgi:tRNA(fMet)-specific endonuclease VapC
MRRYMLDTDICIYLAKNRHPQVTARFEILRPEQLIMSAITYGELHHGANKSNQRERTLMQLAKLIQYVPVESISPDAAQAYGEIRALLEMQGRVIGNNDLWIAAHAVTLDVTLATNNEREFERIPGITVENWTK